KEFGKEYFKGKNAIDFLLKAQAGHIENAFYKEGLGDIDLVWGEITDLEKHKGYGLAHILDKRKSEFVEQGASESEAAQKAVEFAKNEISNIMQNGKIINKANEATRIETQDYKLILKQNWSGEPLTNKWLVTAYIKNEKGESISSTPFTKGDNLPLNSSTIIPQTPQEIIKQAKEQGESIAQKANLEAANKQKDKELLEAYEKANFKGKCELVKEDINEEIKALEKQREELKRIIQQKDYNDIELEQARKILDNAKEEVEGHYRIKYMQNGKEMGFFLSKYDYSKRALRTKDEILHEIIKRTMYGDKITNIEKTINRLKEQIEIIDKYLKEYGDNEAGAISDDIIEKFKYYDFAKDTPEGGIIIGKMRKTLYEQAQKVLKSRFLKMKGRAQKSSRDYNITYDEARKLFYKGDMSEEQKDLFESVLPIAQKLNVRIRTAIREPYEDMMQSTKDASGLYRYSLNTATLKKGAGLSDTKKAQVLLHELIHSVTSRAMSLHKTSLRDKMLSKTQIRAIDGIEQIYKKLYKFRKTFKLQDEYGLTNMHEMLAELANPMFSNKLKEIGLYEKVINNIMKIILSVRDFIRLRSDKNVYEKIKQCLKDIIENYKDDFTQEYEKQNIRDFTLTSQTQKEQIYTQRQEIKNTLKAKINQAITNENTGEKAILTNKGISKMLSDKAIQKA
ncbi:hypothetical protein NYG95_08825, partial [Campylobacter felis]|nr:hypothetical protein [Campylobacter felis]